MSRKIEKEIDLNKNLKHDPAEQRKNALKLITIVFVIPLVAVAISVALR